MHGSRWFVRAHTLAHICQAATSVDDASVAAVGFKRVPSAGVRVSPTTLPVSFFVPLFFPIEQTQGASPPEPFDWNKAPQEITVVAVVASQERYRNGDRGVRLRDVNAFRESCLDARRQFELVRDTAAYVRASVEILREAFDLGARNREVRLEIAGYSQGGAIAAAATLGLFTWAQSIGINIYCTTFEAPGVHASHLRAALPNKHVWEEHVVNFVCDPNPINTINQHFGRVVHLKGNKEWMGGWTWTVRCLVVETLRMVALLVLGHCSLGKCLVEIMMKSVKSGVKKIGKRIALAAVLWLSSGVVSGMWQPFEEKAERVFQLVLGKSPDEMAEGHSLKHVLECLKLCKDHSDEDIMTEMDTWPQYDALGPSLSELMLGIIQMNLPFGAASAGLRFAFDRKQLMSNRLLVLKGYKPRL